MLLEDNSNHSITRQLPASRSTSGQTLGQNPASDVLAQFLCVMVFVGEMVKAPPGIEPGDGGFDKTGHRCESMSELNLLVLMPSIVLEEAPERWREVTGRAILEARRSWPRQPDRHADSRLIRPRGG